MIRKIVLGFALSLLIADTNGARSDELHRLFDEYWDHEMEINPFAATTPGINIYNDRVPNVSRSGKG